MWIAFFVFIISLCLYFAGYSVWWVLGVPAATAAMLALHALYEKSTLAFVSFLLMFDISAYVPGVSLWWVLGVPAGFVALCILSFCILDCHQDMDERRYSGSDHAYSVPSHSDRTINERTRLLPSYTSRPPAPAETPQRIAPSQSSYMSRSPIGTAPRVLPAPPSTSFRAVVDPGLPRYTTPTYPSPPIVDTRRPRYANPTSGALTTVAGRQPVLVAPSSTQPARKIPQYTTPTYPSPPIVDTRHPRYANPTSGVLTTVAGRQLVLVASSSTQPARKIPQYTTPTYPSSAIVDTKRPRSENPTSGALTTVAGRQPVLVAPNGTQPARKIPARREVNGMLLDASVTAEVDDRYPYDQQIKTDSAPHSATRSVAGVFKCYNCKRKKPREWTSYGICVEIWMSSTGHRYRTQLNSQKCKHCKTFVEPEVDKDDYVTKVVRVLDGWTGQHSVVKPLQYYPPTGPHQTDNCHACQKGICHQKPTK